MGAAYGSRRALHGDLGGGGGGDAVADALVGKLKPKVEALAIGNGATRGLDMGPLVTGVHRDKVRSYIDLARRKAPSWWSTAAA